MKFTLKLIIILALFAQANTGYPQYPGIIKWLNENSVEIKTVNAENGFDDLMPLKNILENKRIVALGESTHGTKEIFQMKHRLLEFLVREMGFRNFAVEANFTEALALNDYVMFGIGDPQELLDGLYFWTLNTKEVLDMIYWMRNYNKNKKYEDKLKFYGFDMQVPTIASRELQKYFRQVDTPFAEQVGEYFSLIEALPEIEDSVIYRRNIAKCLQISGTIQNQFNNEKEKYISKWGNNKYEIAKKNFDITNQFFKIALEPIETQNAIRDKCMSENVEWLLNHEGNNSKFVLWAHNFHITKEFKFSNGGSTMGSHLKNIFKDDYYALGFDIYKGSFQAVRENEGLVENEITSKKNSTGYIFSHAKNEIFFVDMETAIKDK